MWVWIEKKKTDREFASRPVLILSHDFFVLSVVKFEVDCYVDNE